MVPLSRREFASASLSIVGLLAGCATLPLSQPSPASRVSASASVIEPATDRSPLTVELALTNASPRAITVSSDGNVPLEHLPGFEEVVLYPVDPVEVSIEGNLPAERTDGCWRVRRTDGTRPEIVASDVARALELAPGEAHAVRHRVYHDGDAGACLPAGEYRTVASLEFGDPTDGGPSAELEVVLTIPGRGEPSIDLTVT